MGQNTKISWCHHTMNAWWGCHKVSPACRSCYAEAWAKRTGHSVWGPGAPRRFFGDKHWAEPFKWDRAAEKAGERRRVFCGSMMDVLEIHPDEEIAAEMRAARMCLWMTIFATPHLDWLLLTKRPENAEGLLPASWWKEGCPANVWFGTTVENQEYADIRIPHLLKVKARVLFLSCEPLLGPINLHQLLCEHANDKHPEQKMGPWCTARSGLWVIAGGESGPHHREHQLEWSRSLRDQCAAAQAPFFFKQLGENATTEQHPGAVRPRWIGEGGDRRRLVLAKRSKGESLDEIPPDLRVREFPRSP